MLMDISVGKIEKGMDISIPRGHIHINPRENTDASMCYGCIPGYIHVLWMYPGMYPRKMDASWDVSTKDGCILCLMDASLDVTIHSGHIQTIWAYPYGYSH
jgi:hypothetical protein